MPNQVGLADEGSALRGPRLRYVMSRVTAKTTLYATGSTGLLLFPTMSLSRTP